MLVTPSGYRITNSLERVETFSGQLMESLVPQCTVLHR